MDKVRFGRALGYGARHAARTFSEAAKAAATPTPRPAGSEAQSAAAPSAPARTQSQVSNTIRDAGSSVLEAQRAYSQAKQRTVTQAASAGRSMFAPVKRVGGVLWLELTGTIYTLFAFGSATALWKIRAAVHAHLGSSESISFYFCLLVFALFSYFAISSFVRARRREKQR